VPPSAPPLPTPTASLREPAPLLAAPEQWGTWHTHQRLLTFDDLTPSPRLALARTRIDGDKPGVLVFGTAPVASAEDTSGFRGVNWADPRDNYAADAVVPSGLSISDSYATTYAKASADGVGVVSHAGVGMPRELALDTGLVAGVSQVLADTYAGPWVHARQAGARAAARERAWAAGAGPDLTGLLHIDFDATVTISHSENKRNAAKTWKKTFGYHPLLAFLDRPEVSGGEALAGLPRPGNAGSNTAADQVTVLEQALAALPEHARPRPGDPDSVRVVARSDSAGACRGRGVWFSFGFPVDTRIQGIVDQIPDQCWEPAIQTDGGIRDGAWVAEATGPLELAAWPDGSRVFPRAERPHPGAQLRFTDADGHRITAFITDIPDRVIPGQAAGRELRHRQHARVEDRIREAKATGPRNLPCRGWDENVAWLETLLTATETVCCTSRPVSLVPAFRIIRCG
jgi:Transposase DDE domain group 1